MGTGFTDTVLRDLFAKLQPLATSKRPLDCNSKVPKGTTWVRPELVAQVKFANWTEEGRLRAPVYIGLRVDKPAVEVIREKPAPDASVKFTNVNKVYFPEQGYTKGELLLYYDTVADLLARGVRV